METQQLTETALRGAASSRSAEAHLLLKKGRWNGAVIMAYYAVECLLKAIIARNSLSGNLREEFFRHLNKYEMLVDAAGLGKMLRFAPDIHEKLKIVASL